MNIKQLFEKYIGKNLHASGEDPGPYQRAYQHGIVNIEDIWDIKDGTFGFRVVPTGSDKGYVYPGVDDVQPIHGGIKVIYSNAFGNKGFLNLTERSK